jgi:hypothetical protein
MMAKDKTKTAPAKKEPAIESKTAEAAPKAEGIKTESVKAESVKAEGAKADPVTPESTPRKQGMGEAQKAVTQAYRDNWDAIFGKKKKR